MLTNPFTPSSIASAPDEFFGRADELDILSRTINQGSIAIQGAIGIGKSSLLAQARLRLEGFGTERSCKTIVTVADRDIRSVDDAARSVMERFIQVDQTQNRVQVNIGKVIEYESKEICSYFSQGRHLAALNRVITAQIVGQNDMLVIVIDETDKAPVPFARLIRSMITHVQHEGLRNIRFMVAGVSPFLLDMIAEDHGISRFFYKTITLTPLGEEDSSELVETKLQKCVDDAWNSAKLNLSVHPHTVANIVKLSGGHPHLLQLLGSHLIENEEQDPDGVLDARDLTSALRTICYEDRGRVYDSILHVLALEGKLQPLRELLTASSSRCPTRVYRSDAEDLVEVETLRWLVDNNILTVVSKDEYGLGDEFLRIRLMMDDEQEDGKALAYRLAHHGAFVTEIEEWRLSQEFVDEDEDE